MKNKLAILLVVALLIGGVTTVYSYGKIKEHQKKELELVPIVVAATKTEPYSLLSDDSIKIEYVSSKFVDEFTATDLSEVNGKITTIPLYKDKPIDIRLIADKPEEIGNKQVVGVHIDAVRFAGVGDGDIVDIYWLDKEELSPAQKIAHNVRVLRVTDEKGVPLNESINIARSAATSAGLVENKNPRIVYLLLEPEEVPYVIQGSTPGSTKISFSKKPVEDNITFEVIKDEHTSTVE